MAKKQSKIEIERFKVVRDVTGINIVGRQPNPNPQAAEYRKQIRDLRRTNGHLASRSRESLQMSN